MNQRFVNRCLLSGGALLKQLAERTSRAAAPFRVNDYELLAHLPLRVHPSDQKTLYPVWEREQRYNFREDSPKFLAMASVIIKA